MGSPNGGNTGGGNEKLAEADAGPKRTTATKIGVGDINEKGQRTKTSFNEKDDNEGQQ